MTTTTATSAGGTGRRTRDRKGELIQIAAELFAQRGFLATTIRDIADAAGIQSGSLYHHFASKESMVEEILAEYWSKLLERYNAVVESEDDVTAAASGLIKASVHLLDECALALRVMLNDWTYLSETFPFMESSLHECQDIWLDVIRRGIESGAFSDSVEPTILYRTIMSSVSGTARWFRPDGPVSVEELSEEMATLFMQGIVSR